MKSAVKKFKGLSDKAIAWIFIAPTLILLLAINIYPLIYAIRMSFTNFYANKIGREVKFVGLKNYKKILGKEEIWEKMQITAHFVCWTLVLQALIGLGLALLLNKKFKGNELLTTLIVLPMMLSPAVVDCRYMDVDTFYHVNLSGRIKINPKLFVRGCRS